MDAAHERPHQNQWSTLSWCQPSTAFVLPITVGACSMLIPRKHVQWLVDRWNGTRLLVAPVISRARLGKCPRLFVARWIVARLIVTKSFKECNAAIRLRYRRFTIRLTDAKSASTTCCCGSGASCRNVHGQSTVAARYTHTMTVYGVYTEWTFCVSAFCILPASFLFSYIHDQLSNNRPVARGVLRSS